MSSKMVPTSGTAPCPDFSAEYQYGTVYVYRDGACLFNARTSCKYQRQEKARVKNYASRQAQGAVKGKAGASERIHLVCGAGRHIS